MTATQDEADRPAQDPETSALSRISGMVDLIPTCGRRAWVMTGFALTVIFTGVGFFADLAELFPEPDETPSGPRKPHIVQPQPKPSEEATLRKQASLCQERAFQHLEDARPEDAVPQFHCAADNFQQAADRGDGLSKVFLARLYSHQEARHFLGQHSREDYLTRAGHLWCEAKAEGVVIAQGEPPFDTNVTC